MRHLYTSETPDKKVKDGNIEEAKSFERRRCNHHTLPEPLSTLECISSVVDPKSNSTNKHRYVVATQDQKVRSAMRQIAGVPLIYINRSVMIMEPMASKTEDIRNAEERGKVRAGLKGRRGASDDTTTALKRKRGDDDDDDDDDADGDDDHVEARAGARPDSDSIAKKKKKGPKGPNPLSVKKSKKKSTPAEAEKEKQAVRKIAKKDSQVAETAVDAGAAASSAPDADTDGPAKKKRRRKHKSGADADAAVADDGAHEHGETRQPLPAEAQA